MLADLRQSPGINQPACEILIVGAGAVGLSLAIDLARRGADVTVLEAGATGVEKRSQEFFETAKWSGYPLEGLHLGRFRALGGTTNFWAGQLVPFDPIVFEERPWVGEQCWPIARSALDPYYERTLDLLGLKERKSDEEVWRALKTPIPELGEDLDVFLTRWAPEPSFAVLFGKEIESHPRLRVVVNAAVTGLSLAEDGRTVQGVTVAMPDGTTRTWNSRQIVLANGTVEIARLLSLPLRDGRRSPWIDNPWLGQGFADHVDAYAGTVVPIDRQNFHMMFDNIMLQGLKYCPKIKLSQAAQRERRLLGIAAHFLFNSRYTEDLDRLKLLVKTLLRGKIDRRVLSIPGRLLPLLRIAIPMMARYMRYRRTYNLADRGIQLRLTAEQVPMKASRLKLRPERDSLGMPLVEVEWMIDGVEIETMATFCEAITAFFERKNLARIELDPLLMARDRNFLAHIDDANHQMGMARMSESPATGVVDANLRVHGSNNLYVAGAATFPTTGFANPTLTAMALGLRLSDRLVAGNSLA